MLFFMFSWTSKSLTKQPQLSHGEGFFSRGVFVNYAADEIGTSVVDNHPRYTLLTVSTLNCFLTRHSQPLTQTLPRSYRVSGSGGYLWLCDERYVEAAGPVWLLPRPVFDGLLRCPQGGHPVRRFRVLLLAAEHGGRRRQVRPWVGEPWPFPCLFVLCFVAESWLAVPMV